MQYWIPPPVFFLVLFHIRVSLSLPPEYVYVFISPRALSLSVTVFVSFHPKSSRVARRVYVIGFNESINYFYCCRFAFWDGADLCWLNGTFVCTALPPDRARLGKAAQQPTLSLVWFSDDARYIEKHVPFLCRMVGLLQQLRGWGLGPERSANAQRKFCGMWIDFQLICGSHHSRRQVPVGEKRERESSGAFEFVRDIWLRVTVLTGLGWDERRDQSRASENVPISPKMGDRWSW